MDQRCCIKLSCILSLTLPSTVTTSLQSNNSSNVAFNDQFSLVHGMGVHVERSGTIDILREKILRTLSHQPLTRISASFEGSEEALWWRRRFCYGRAVQHPERRDVECKADCVAVLGQTAPEPLHGGKDQAITCPVSVSRPLLSLLLGTH